MKWQSYLNLIAKRPRALKYTGFYNQMPTEWQEYFSNCTVGEKKEALHLLAVLLKEHNFEISTNALIITVIQVCNLLNMYSIC